MDTVWIKLTTVRVVDDETIALEENFMFGPTGIVRFRTEDNQTQLFNSATMFVANVAEDSESIMNILRKMRQTEGRLDDKASKVRKAKSSKGSSTAYKASR